MLHVVSRPHQLPAPTTWLPHPADQAPATPAPTTWIPHPRTRPRPPPAPTTWLPHPADQAPATPAQPLLPHVLGRRPHGWARLPDRWHRRPGDRGSPCEASGPPHTGRSRASPRL